VAVREAVAISGDRVLIEEAVEQVELEEFLGHSTLVPGPRLEGAVDLLRRPMPAQPVSTSRASDMGPRRPGSPGGAQQVTGWGLRASEIAPEDLVSHVDAHLAPQAHGVGHTLLRRVNVDLLAGTQAEPLASHVEGAVGGDVGADGWVVDD
jgi:hypothetical protein